MPPFNAPSPPQVFENILMRRIEWFEDEVEVTPEARHLMERLMCSEIENRLGTKSASEIKSHPWFTETPWDNLMEQKVYFIPTVKNIEDTDYFDSKGMNEKPTNLSDSDENVSTGPRDSMKKENTSPKSPGCEDFGEAVYKNLPLLEKANQQTMTKISQDFPETDQWIQRRRDSLPVSSPLNPASNSPNFSKANPRTISANLWLHKRRESLPTSSLSGQHLTNPISVPTSKLATTNSSSTSLPQNTSSGSFGALLEGSRSLDQSMIPTRLSSHNFAPISVTRSNQQLDDFNYGHRHSDTGSFGYSSSPERDSFKKNSQAYLDSAKQTLFGSKSKEALAQTDDSESEFYQFSFFDKPLDVLIADGNPVGSKILETILKNFNCRCIRVKNGAEAVQSLMGDVKFDVIFADINISICMID
jgi:serine/threonine-protein kinase RIM15